MISVQSRRQLSSGNKCFLAAVFFALLSACSPKVAPPVRHPDKPGETPGLGQKPLELKPRVNSIALILPFYSDTFTPQATLKDVSRSALAIDYYQGFKLALDSLVKLGYHFRLEVFDGQNDEIKIANLARAGSVMNNDLIIGPVFPDNIKIFSELATFGNQLQVSPLAATMPSQFNNSRLVTINNTIDQHGKKVAEYVTKHYTAANSHIILINTRSSDSEKFAAPVKRYLNTLSGKSLKVTEVTNSKGIEKILSKSKRNVVIVAAEEQSFIVPTVNRLATLSTAGSYKIDVFGHPNWNRATVDIDQLQQLNTRITSSYTIDYESAPVKQFVSGYHAAYSLDPSEYSFKGFDTGYYFGRLLGEFGKDYKSHLTEAYEGLHNNLRFSYDASAGFKNTEIKMLQYKGYELQVVK